MLASLAGVPTPQRAEKITEIFGNVIPFVGTAGLQFEEMTHRQIVVSTPNERKVQNHIQGVHAVVMALLAETSTGILVGLNLRGDCIPVIKTLKVDYLERAQGALRAVATLSEAQIAEMSETTKGEVEVEVHVTDESGREPIRCQMVWAWVPAKR
ncbi:DUF4442 domain-containing protein [bacterium]|nr:DUF4442 domain-containing protein [bacterium]PJB48528.1 MAG: DUF4442 domain-containing protein [Deltaproteobacteria bacterium CG_4_9_14_3_um_filter_63_12]